MPSDDELSLAEEIFLDICDLPTAEQRREIDQRTFDSPALREEVEAILAADARADAALVKLSSKLQLTLHPGKPPDDRTGEDFGHYRLLKRVGTGGMGDVWLAERNDGRFDAHYAVKLLRRAIATESAILRFEKEGRLLGRLAHRNIAQLIDAGTHGDQPYLVLEYVEGDAIDHYCHSRKLGLRKRIDLFLQVLDGVAHAHANLVVHRDLKPANICVTESGTVKLLDFGVATLSDDTTNDTGSLTQTYGQVLTPDYAAPEQLMGQPISTATDVYSLGLVLYQLLVGDNPRPAGGRSPVDLAAVALPTASYYAAERGAEHARRALSGDLDNILHKATALDPVDRYQSAVAFAADLKNHQTHRPVSAHPPTLSYRTVKFIKRYRGGVATSLLLLVTLISAALIINTLRLAAVEQRDFAFEQQQRAETAGELLDRLLGDASVASDSTSVADVFVASAATIALQTSTDQRYAGQLFFDLSRGFDSLQMSDEEGQYLERARKAAEISGDTDLLVNVLCEESRNANRRSAADALALFERAQILAQDVTRLSPDAVGRCARAQALMLENSGERRQAIDVLEAARAEIDGYPVKAPVTELRLLNELSNHYFRLGRLSEAQDTNDRLLHLFGKTGRLATTGGIVAGINNATLLGAFGQLKEQHDGLIGILNNVDATSPRRDDVLTSIAVSHIKMRQPKEALAVLEPLIVRATAEYGASRRAVFELSLARGYAMIGELESAREFVEKAKSVFSQSPARYEVYLAGIRRVEASLLWQQGDHEQAVADLEAALTEFGYPSTRSSRGVLVLLEVATQFALESDMSQRALTLANDWEAIARSFARDSASSADVGRSCAAKGAALQALSLAEDAIDAFSCAVQSLAGGLGPNHPEATSAKAALATLVKPVRPGTDPGS
ncbi:MAG: serine/threonine-protein kinase [Pseudomonadota bacterium]